MRSSFLSALLIVISVLATAVLAYPSVVRWGGPGYDPASRDKNSSSLFSAHPDFYAPDGVAHFQIWVDSEKTVKGVWRMVIRQEGQEDIASTYCNRAQQHFSAPYSCRFRKADFLERTGMGKLKVFDQNSRELLTSPVDIIQIKQVF